MVPLLTPRVNQDLSLLIGPDEVCMARLGAEHAEIAVFVGAHPVGEGFRGVFHAHRPQGWAPTKKRSLAVLFKTSMGRSHNDHVTLTTFWPAPPANAQKASV